MKEVKNLEKFKSKNEYKLGTILFDESEKKTYEVTKSERISLFDEFKYGITIKEIEVNQ